MLHAGGRDFRVCLSVREVKEVVWERGVVVTEEAIRKGCGKCGHQYTNPLPRRRPRPGDKGHLEAGLLTLTGQYHDLRRALRWGRTRSAGAEAAGQAGGEDVLP